MIPESLPYETEGKRQVPHYVLLKISEEQNGYESPYLWQENTERNLPIQTALVNIYYLQSPKPPLKACFQLDKAQL